MSQTDYTLNEDEEDRQLKAKKLSSRVLVYICAICLVLAIIVGLLIFYLKDKPQPRTGIVIDCRQETKEQCEKVGCEWIVWTDTKVPRCRVPDNKGYKVVNETLRDDGMGYVLEHGAVDSENGIEVHTVIATVTYITPHIVRLKLEPSVGKVYEIPDQLLPVPTTTALLNETEYRVTSSSRTRFGVQVLREGAAVFDTNTPGLSITPQYLEITTKLASGTVYGFGTDNKLKLDMNWNTVPIFAQKQRGAHPFFLNIESSGRASGVFMRNSNAMDVLLQPDPHPAVTFHVTGGLLDLFVFLGPSPKDVLSQYSQIVGRPFMPPRWSLGLHLGGHHDNQTELSNLVQRNSAGDIPFDVIHSGSRHSLDAFDVSAATATKVTDLVKQHKAKYVYVSQAAVDNHTSHASFIDGMSKQIFIVDAKKKLFLSKMNTLDVVYPDYTNPDSQAWLDRAVNRLQKKYSLTTDGFLLDGNQPYSSVVKGCTDGPLNQPPYTPKGISDTLSSHTVCMDARQKMGRHYDLHNLYGHSQSLIAQRVLLPKSRAFIASLSTFSGSQMHAAHWLGHTLSTWEHLRLSLRSLLAHSLLGFSMSGADICGEKHVDDTDGHAELCMRWTQLAAFSTFTRSYTSDYLHAKDPGSFSDNTRTAMSSILLTRYKLLPYLYTCMYLAHTLGAPIVTPLFVEYPSDKKTWSIESQYLWGPGLMVSPATRKGQTKVKAYFPAGRWFSYFTGAEIQSSGQYVTLDTPLATTNLHVRGGHIIPWATPQHVLKKFSPGPANRNEGFVLLVAMDSDQKASGQLYWDDGESSSTPTDGAYTLWTFSVENNALNLTQVHGKYSGRGDEMKIRRVDFLGLLSRPSSLVVTNATSTQFISFDKKGYSVIISPPQTSFHLSWAFY